MDRPAYVKDSVAGDARRSVERAIEPLRARSEGKSPETWRRKVPIHRRSLL